MGPEAFGQMLDSGSKKIPVNNFLRKSAHFYGDFFYERTD